MKNKEIENLKKTALEHIVFAINTERDVLETCSSDEDETITESIKTLAEAFSMIWNCK